MNLTKYLTEEPLNRVERKKKGDQIRYVTFNVNGAKTLFNYYPWNKFQQNFDTFFSSFDGDIISLQELKVSPSNISSLNISSMKKYKSFISLSKEKKGYSGVGLFVRIPGPEETDHIKNHLLVVKAEEGITGCLQSSEDSKVAYRDLDTSKSIGGYDGDLDYLEGLKLDSEGRCVVIELTCNTVVFSVYCPANSMGTEDGENFRLKFLSVLFERCYRLKYELQKEVIILGDINVSLDLIDNADGINDRLKQGLIQPSKDGATFESINFQQCLNFKSSKPSRKMLNEYVFPTIKTLIKTNGQFLYDTTRYNKERTTGIYTVWNTLTGARQTNYGSRIDLILTSSSNLVENISNAGIWPFILGSDHCPVFTDFDIKEQSGAYSNDIPKSLAFEAKNFYNLVRHHDISEMFKRQSENGFKRNIEKVESSTDIPKRKLLYTNRKNEQKTQSQSNIAQFFVKERSSSSSLDESESRKSQVNVVKNKQNPLSIANISEIMYGKTPVCHHGMSCQMKTSLNNSKTRGKKYWCCSKNRAPVESLTNNEDSSKYQCSFFEWAKTNNKS